MPLHISYTVTSPDRLTPGLVSLVLSISQSLSDVFIVSPSYIYMLSHDSHKVILLQRCRVLKVLQRVDIRMLYLIVQYTALTYIYIHT